MRKFEAVVVAVSVSVAVLATALIGMPGASTRQAVPQPTLRQIRVLVGTAGHPITVEVADTDEERAVGLMARTSMPRDRGMIFVWPDEGPRSFWMKDTLIPLDMVFIRRGGTVAVVRAGAVPMSEESVRSGEPVSAVLEVDAGVAKDLGIVPGSRVVPAR